MLRKRKEDKTEHEIPNVFASTYGVEVLMEGVPNLPVDALLEKLKHRCGDVELMANNQQLISFGFKEYRPFGDNQVPAQIAIMIADQKPQVEGFHASFNQSWGWAEARNAVEKANCSILFTDFMSSNLEHKARLQLFQTALYTFVELVPCLAIHWRLTEQFVSPEQYLNNKPEDENYDLLFGALNVRLYSIEGKANETLMDTLGLSVFGLPDLQCHFKNLDDANGVANLLYVYGNYIFMNGDVINDNETIQGLSADDKWRCQHEISLTEPKRVVLDINPGKFAAGNRK